jgi:UDP-glucose 4-epimerase
LADKIILKLNSVSKIKFLDYSEAYSEGFEDMMRRKPSISKIEKFIGWKPKFNLENIIIDVANHCKI